MSIDEQARVSLFVNGDAAGQQLEELRTRAMELRKEMTRLEQANDLQGMKKAEKEYKALSTQMRQLQRQTVDVDRVMKNLSGASLKDLEKVYRKLNGELKSLSANTKEFADKSKQLSKVSEQMNRVKASMSGTTKGAGMLNSVIGKLGPAMAATFTIGSVVQLGKAMIQTRQEFEKYEAVLKNTLGSQEAARMEMSMLTEFASKTPFQLNQLTGAFVKLVNQGFKPGQEDLTRLGDLAASTGKEFDQLAEALIDAQVGEFERLKEFGIRSQKEGDKVKFTFKGVTQEVAFTSEAIQEYVLSLGDAAGVQGSMAEISKTLGGRISNMKDAWDSMLNAMGSRSSGVFATVISWLTQLIEGIRETFYSVKQMKEMAMDDATRSNLKNAIEEINVMTQSLAKNGMNLKAAQDRALKLYLQSTGDTLRGYEESIKTANDTDKEHLQTKIDLLTAERRVVQDHYTQLAKIQGKKTAGDGSESGSGVDLQKRMDDIVNDMTRNLLKSIESGEYFKEKPGELEVLGEELQKQFEAAFEPFEYKKDQIALNFEYWMQSTYDGQLFMLRQLLDDQLIAEQEYADKVKEIEQNMADEAAKTEQEKLDGRLDSLELYADAAMSMMETVTKFSEAMMNRELKAAGNNEKKKEEIERKYRNTQKAFAIAQTVIEGAVEIARINSNAGVNADLTQTLRTILTALAVARTAGTVALIASQKFDVGGYTGTGGKYDPAGIVHADEYVIPQEGYHNPTIRPVIDQIELARVTGNLARMNLAPFRGYAGGGPVAPAQPSAQLMPQPIQAQDPELKELLKILNQQIRQGIHANVVYTELERAQDDVTAIRAKTRMG